MVRAILLCGILALGACASVQEGTRQRIFVKVAPWSAACHGIGVDGQAVGAFDPATHIYTVDKSRDDIRLTCAAPGYKDKTVTLHPKPSDWSLFDDTAFEIGLVDTLSGAIQKYDTTAALVLDPAATTTPLPAGQLAGALRGRTVYLVDHRTSADVTDYYQPDGRLIRRDDKCETSGRWTVRATPAGQELCVTLYDTKLTTACYGVTGTIDALEYHDTAAAEDGPTLIAWQTLPDNPERLSWEAPRCLARAPY
jgi:hypothetical protein